MIDLMTTARLKFPPPYKKYTSLPGILQSMILLRLLSVIHHRSTSTEHYTITLVTDNLSITSPTTKIGAGILPKLGTEILNPLLQINDLVF